MANLFTTEEAGVTVTKNVDSDGDEVQIGLRLNSSREGPLSVRVVDTVPPSATVQAVTADRACWSTTDETVEYERTLEPKESVTTGYKYTRTGIETASHCPPELLVDGDVAQDADGVTPSDEGEGRDGATAREADADDEFEMPEDEVSVTEMVRDDAAEDAATAADEASTDGGAAAGAGSDRAPTPDSAAGTADAAAGTTDDVDALVDAILETLEADATPAQRDRLARLLGDGERPATSLELRVADLQSRFHDLATYVDAMEEFVDEHGTGEAVLTEVLDELAAIREGLDDVRDDQATLETRLEGVEERLADVEDGTDRIESTVDRRTEALETEIERLDETVETRRRAVDDDLAELEDALDRTRATQETVQEQMEQFTAFREAIQGAFQRDQAPDG